LESGTKKAIAAICLIGILTWGVGFGGFQQIAQFFQKWTGGGQLGPFENVVFYSKYAMSGSNADINWNIYDENGTFIESATASSGQVTIGTMLRGGQTIIIQAVANDPSDGVDPYLSPPIKVTVPMAEAGDTVSLGTFYVYDVSTAPTLSATDQDGNSVADATLNYINTTDTAVRVSITGVDEDTVFGLGEIIEYLETGDHYDGLFLVWKGTVAQEFTDVDYFHSDPSNVYYVWRLGQIVNDADVPGDGSLTVSITVNGGFTADSSVTITIVDMCKVQADGEPVWSALFSSDVAVTAITTKVA